MRTIQINQRAARLLRENMTTSQEGYEYPDLLRLDNLAKKLTELQGDYAVRMAELAREEKALRRKMMKAVSSNEREDAQRSLMLLQFEAEDLNDDADETQVELQVSEVDYKLIADKLDNVTRWSANDALRSTIVLMVEAVKTAESDEPEEEKPKQLRRR